MKEEIFRKTRFITTAMEPKGYPTLRSSSGSLIDEVAVAGRSNVGKSSLLNHLCQKTDLVKTSSVPGKTQGINFFAVEEKLVLVDLPGYGFANVPEQVRKNWGPMIESYLKERPQLKLILFLFDIRRMPNEDDLSFLKWIVHHQKPMLLVLTKVDKVNQNEKKLFTQKILQAMTVDGMEIDCLHHILYSAAKNIGRKDLIKHIELALNTPKDSHE